MCRASGRVIKAKHKKLQNFFIAVKIIPLSNKEVQEEIEKEMEILQTCRSDNVIAYYGCILRTNDTWVRFQPSQPLPHILSVQKEFS